MSKYVKTPLTLLKTTRKLNNLLSDANYVLRYMDELGFHNTADKLNIYRKYTPNHIFDNTNDLYDSFYKCKQNIRIMQHKNKVDILDLKYKLIKPLGGGKSGAFVFLAKCLKTGNNVVIKLYTLRLISQKKIVDRDLREIFVSCALSGVDGFPKVYEFGYTYFNRSSKYWEPFAEEIKICSKGEIIDPSLYNKCYFLVTDFANGKPLDKINLFNLSPKTLIHILFSIKDLLIIAGNKIPEFIHKDLHPGNILIDENMKVTIIDFDIANSSEYTYNMDYVRQASGYILPQEALINMVIKYIGMKNTFYLAERTATLAKHIDSDFRIWFVYKILFETIILYKLSLSSQSQISSIPPNIASKLITILLNSAHLNNLCNSIKNCDMDYFSPEKQNMSDSEFTEYIAHYFDNIISSYKTNNNNNKEADLQDTMARAVTGVLNTGYKNVANPLGNNINANISGIESTIVTGTTAARQTAHIMQDLSSNKHYHKFIIQIKKIGSSIQEFETNYYNKFHKHLEFSDFNLVFNVQFKDFNMPIHNSNDSYIIHVNSKNKEKDDGINIFLNTTTLTIKFKNVEIKTDNLSHIVNKNSIRGSLPFGDIITDKVINSIIGNLSTIEYNFRNKTIKLDANSTLSLTRILSSISNSETGSKKITKILKKLDCDSSFNIMDYLSKKQALKIIPLVIYFIQNMPSKIRLGIQKNDDPTFYKDIDINLNYDFVQNTIFMLDELMSNFIDKKLNFKHHNKHHDKNHNDTNDKSEKNFYDNNYKNMS